MQRLGFVLLLVILNVICARAQIVALGASNTQGFGVNYSDSYPAQLEALLRKRGLNVTVKNEGVSGNTSLDILNRLDSAVPNGTRVVILETGAYNDAFARNINHDANVRSIIDKLRAKKISIVVVGEPGEVRQSGASYCAARRIPGQYRVGNVRRGIHGTAEAYALVAAQVEPCVMRAWGK
jgi:acyl-CoA thioesterase I